MRAAASLLTAVLVLSAALVTSAQSGGERATAQALFDEGIRLFKAKQYSEACPKFEESLKFVDGLGTRGKLAECYEKTGRLASAWAMYREVAQLASKRGERRRERVATQRAKKLEPNLAYMIIRMPASVLSLSGLKVVRNKVEMGRAIVGTLVAVDSGTHQIVVSADGYKPWEATVEVAAKGETSVVVPELEKLPPPPPEAETKRPGVVQPQVVAKPEPTSSWRSPVSIGLMAGGGLALVGGVVAGVMAKSKWDEAKDGGCDTDTGVCPDQASFDASESARSRATWANVLTISGVALAGTGLVFWLWPSDDGGESQVSLSPAASVDEVGLTFSGRF